MTFEGHICCCTYMVIAWKINVAVFFQLDCGVYMQNTVLMQWDIQVQWGKYVCSGAYANNMKCMYISVYGHIGNCTVFI